MADKKERDPDIPAEWKPPSTPWIVTGGCDGDPFTIVGRYGVICTDIASEHDARLIAVAPYIEECLRVINHTWGRLIRSRPHGDEEMDRVEKHLQWVRKEWGPPT